MKDGFITSNNHTGTSMIALNTYYCVTARSCLVTKISPHLSEFLRRYIDRTDGFIFRSGRLHFRMQTEQTVEGELFKKQSSLDQTDPTMFDSQKVNDDSMVEYIPSTTYQVDPYDVVHLLRDPLLRLSSSANSTCSDQERSILVDCIRRLYECEKLVESTRVSSGITGRRFTKEEFAFVNKFVADSEAVLKFSYTDDKTWGSNVPETLVLKDMLGCLPLSQISTEEKFQVRGKSYLIDGKKVPAAAPLFFLRGLQVVEQPRGCAAASHVAIQDWCGFPKSYDQYNEWLILNYMVPGATHVNVVCLFTASREALEVINSIGADELIESHSIHHAHAHSHPHQHSHPHHSHAPQHIPAHSSPHSHSHKKSPSKKHKHLLGGSSSTLSSPAKRPSWANSLVRFWTGPDSYRNRTFKLFPRMVKASWAIQAAVGTKPALIGNKKLELKYFRGPGYLEVDIDLSSSTIATHILGMVRGVSKSMVVDLGVGLEGTEDDELPEAILGQARFDRVDLDSAVPVPVPMSNGVGVDGVDSKVVQSKSSNSSSVFSFGWGGSSSESSQASSVAYSTTVVEKSDVVNSPSKKDILLEDTPAQKLRRALAVGNDISTKAVSGSPGAV